MKNKIYLLSAVLLLLSLGTSRSFASAPDAFGADVQVNLNGSVDRLFTDPINFPTTPGFSDAGYNYLTGLGSFTETYTPGAAGTYFFDLLIDEEVGTPFYNEFGSTAGALLAGEKYEVAGIDATLGTPGAIYTDAAGATSDGLKNTNTIPSGASNLLGNCTGNCNGDVAIALGYTFSLNATDTEIITVNVSLTAPTSGFYIQQTNANEGSVVYFSLTASTRAGGPPPPPPAVPEPSSWVLVASGLGAGVSRLRRRLSFKGSARLFSVVALFAIALLAAPFAGAQQVNTVPWDPTNPAAPHTAYAGANIVLGAVFIPAAAPGPFTYVWNFGDGTPVGAASSVTNPNDISARHIYAKEADGVTNPVVGYNWTATVTVTDTTTSSTYTGNYLVIWQDVNNLQARVNVAIDLGLWHLHQAMYHPTATTGTWTSCHSGYAYGCGGDGYGSMDATNVQAFEVDGHLKNGPATDPYTSDVAEGFASMLTHLVTTPSGNNTYTYNPAKNNFGCSDGTAPTTTNQGTVASPNYCAGAATQVFYTPGATSCTAPPCTINFDGNGNNLAIYSPQYNSLGYEQGMYIDALVASGTPNATATVGTTTESYANIVQDMMDWIGHCQYPGDSDVAAGATRGSSGYQGGGWYYYCQAYDDNSVSQWAAIGLVAGQRGFGLTIPPIVSDANNMWVTTSQEVRSPKPTAADPWATGADYGAFGYDASLQYSLAWGPFATTPSGMVQMSMDGIGRTKNTVFGDASNDPDQRFNNVETWYADNFCNNPASGAYYAPRDYTYGLFSFTKAMLLHNPNNSLSPIQYLRTQTPNVFTGNVSIPANTIDWYSAIASGHFNGSDPCDGVAQTIVGRQNADGSWNGHYYSGEQDSYEPAWSLIMLQRTVFVNCVNNLGGRGVGGTSRTPARVDLSWTGIPNVTGYNVLISTTSGGPYTQVAYGGGTTTLTAFSDRSGLTNGHTYYFVLQPINGSGTVCQSNQATVAVP